MATPNMPTMPDYTIDQEKQTVQGQLNNVLNQNNPLMQKAASQGQQYANKRGLLNSSIGAGASQSAMMDYAMPIAQADAATNNQYAMNKYNTQLDLTKAQYGNDLQKDILSTQEDINTRNLAMTTSANTQGEYLSSIDTIIKEAMVSVNEIETTEGITAADKATMIANTVKRRDADLAFMRSLYSNMPTWDFSWVDIDQMPTAPGV